MNDFALLVGYFVTATVVVLASLIVLDRHWGTSVLRGLVKPKHPLFYEGRPRWTKEPLMYQILGLPATSALFIYTLILMPDRLLLISWTLLAMWFPTLLYSICMVESKTSDMQKRDKIGSEEPQEQDTIGKDHKWT